MSVRPINARGSLGDARLGYRASLLPRRFWTYYASSVACSGQ